MRLLKKTVVTISSGTSYLFFLASKTLAQTNNDIQAAVGSVNPNSSPFTNLGKLIQSILQLIYYGAGLFFFIYLLIGGLQWITSGGDKAGVEAARNKITNAAIGLVIVVAAYAITLIVEKVLGIKIVSGFQFQGPGG